MLRLTNLSFSASMASIQMPVPTGECHKKDKHAGSNPHCTRKEAAEANGFMIHDASQMTNENWGCGGFGSVHKAQLVPTMAMIETMATVDDVEMEYPEMDLLAASLQKACTGSPDTASTNSGGSDGRRSGSSSDGDAVMTPTQEFSVAERVSAMRQKARIEDTKPLAQSSEPPLGAIFGADRPLYALKSGPSDKDMVLEEEKIWTTVSEIKHPYINNLLGSFASTIPAHTTTIGEDGEEREKEYEERPCAHFVTPWLSADLHDRVHAGFTDAKGVAHPKQMSREEMTKFAYDIAVGLYHMHGMGLAHRDLKPANVLVTESGTAKLTDFGISAYPNITAGNTLSCHLNCIGMHHFPNHVGTSHYSSPQQISYRLRVIEIIPGEDGRRTRERRIPGQTINPRTGELYQVCIALLDAAAVKREQKRWFDYGFHTYVQPGCDFEYEGQLDGGCQASGKMDVWALGTLMLESLTGESIYNVPKSEHNIMRHWIKLAHRPYDNELRTVWSDDGTSVTETEFQIRKQISTIKYALEYLEAPRASALQLAYRLATVGLATDEELRAKGIDPNNLGGRPEDLLDANGELPIRAEALQWDNSVHAQLAHQHPTLSEKELRALHAQDVAQYKTVQIEGPNTGLNLVSKNAKSGPVRLVKNVRAVQQSPPKMKQPENKGLLAWGASTLLGIRLD